MKTKLIGATLVMSVLVAMTANAQTLNTQGDGFVFSLNVPTGWVNDAKATEGQHLKGLILPEGKRWETAGSRMYTSVSLLDKGESIVDVIEYDTRVYKTVAAAVVTEETPVALKNAHGTARLLKIVGAGDGYEAIAYFNENKAIPFVILSSTSKEAFDKDLATFKEMVATYQYNDITSVAHD